MSIRHKLQKAKHIQQMKSGKNDPNGAGLGMWLSERVVTPDPTPLPPIPTGKAEENLETSLEGY